MIFNSFPFVVFFLLLFLLVRSMPHRHVVPIVLAGSLLFYTAWYPVYILLLLIDVLVNYLLMRKMLRSPSSKFFLTISITFTLAVLAWFKYSTLVVDTISPLLFAWLGIEIAPPSFFLPLGISFYSFQIIALMVDISKKRIEPPRNFLQFLLFIVFFPQLIAGPIVRGAELLSQLNYGGRITSNRSRRGIWLLTSGLLKKVIIGDFLLADFVNEVFSAPAVGSAGYHLIALYSFSFLIYFDFSGYSDIARGLSCLLGFELPFNFKEPYLSRNPSEFWRRWHITLSTWLKDYLYIPLGGNRSGTLRTYLNLIITMLLGGLWHGAAWNFVIWGAMHGILLAFYRLRPRNAAKADTTLTLKDIPQTIIFFHMVCLLWVFFRAPTFEDATIFLTTLFTGSAEGGARYFKPSSS